MWGPEPGWQRLATGMGSSTVGVWLVEGPGRAVVVKRLARPQDDDAPELSMPHHYAWWRREAEVALGPGWPAGSGLCTPRVVEVTEDDEGVTVSVVKVETEELPGPFLARTLGHFAAQSLPDVSWLTRDLLRDRVRRVDERGGWRTIARTTVADVADALWSRRASLLERFDALPHGPAHGDPTRRNLLGRSGTDVTAVDWQMFGSGPHGADLGYLALSCREEFDVLLGAWLEGHAEAGGRVDAAEVRFGASVMAGLTALTQADWALARVAEGEGPLAAKYAHPSVAPHLRTLQRQFPHLEALLH